MVQEPHFSLAGRMALTVLVAGGFLALPRDAAASCETAASLAELHAAYGDLIEGGGTPRADIGRHVFYRDIAGEGLERFTTELAEAGFFSEGDRILPALLGMRELSLGSPAGVDLDRHRANRNSLGEALRATGCFKRAAAETEAEPGAKPEPSGAPQLGAGTRTGAPEEPGRLGLLRGMGRFVETAGPGSYAVVALAISALGALSLFVRNHLQKVRARAYPRYALDRALNVIDSRGRRDSAIVVNISRGGVMLTRSASLEAEFLETASISLSGLTVAMSISWENEYFFGMAFNEPIPQDLLLRVLGTGDAKHPVESAAAPA